MDTIITGIIGAFATIVAAIIGKRGVDKKNKEIEQLKIEWQNFASKTAPQESYLDIDYGISIISPKDGEPVGQYFKVTGVYTVMPPPDVLRIFTCNSDRTPNGERYWPQEIVKRFDSKTKTWTADVNIGDPDPAKKWSLIVAIVGQPSTVLWDYYYKAGPTLHWWDFEGWPNDSVICHRINNIKRT